MEVLYTEEARDPQAFLEEVRAIFQEVLGTPKDRLQVAFYPLPDPGKTPSPKEE